VTVRIINADVIEGLRQLPDESVHCVVTSPPYWGLRDYGAPGQIGLEPTPQQFIERLTGVFREVRRVLRTDGTCWINMGDSYAGSWGAQSRGDDYPGTLGHPSKKTITARQIAPAQRHALGTGSSKRTPGLKPKDLIGQPWRLAFALQDDGWWLRADIIWSIPNPMPESVSDRPTKAHEYIFLLTKSDRYVYDAEAIMEFAVKTGTPGHLGCGQNSREFVRRTPNAPDKIKSPHGQGFTRRASATDKGARPPGTPPQSNLENVPDAPFARNKRSVWTIATTPFPEAHFATFPPELPAICIKAGCPAGGTVLDPFGGAGTTGLVADRLQRNAILIELNPEYAAMASRRINGDRGVLLDMMEVAP